MSIDATPGMRRGSIITSGFTHEGEPQLADVMNASARRPSNYEAIKAGGKKTQNNTALTGASALTLRQSIVPLVLVTTLFFVSRPVGGALVNLPTYDRCGVSPMVFSTR